MNKDLLNNAGINWEKGLERMLDDEELYTGILLSYLEDETIKSAETQLAQMEYSDLFDSVHTLKGLAGNMDMTELYAAASKMTEQLRNNFSPDQSELEKSFADIKAIDAKIREAISKAF